MYYSRNKFLSLLLAAAVIIGFIFYTSQADATEGDNWCGDWIEGYQIGYCWSHVNCDYIPHRMCPYPIEGETGSYLLGLTAGLDAGASD